MQRNRRDNLRRQSQRRAVQNIKRKKMNQRRAVSMSKRKNLDRKRRTLIEQRSHVNRSNFHPNLNSKRINRSRKLPAIRGKGRNPTIQEEKKKIVPVANQLISAHLPEKVPTAESNKPTITKENYYEGAILLVSYPKSGNTWTRFILSKLYYDRKVDFDTVDDTIPNMYTFTEDQLTYAPLPRIIKSHEPYNQNYRKVVYLVRDVRDVVISYFHHFLKHINSELDFNEFLEDFINGKIWPGSWEQHVQSWLNHQAAGGEIIVIKYEDLLSHTHREIKKINDFLKIPKSSQEIENAISWASFKNMKSIEERKPWGNKLIPFVRKGKTQDWKTSLTHEQQDKIFRHFGKMLTKLDYPNQ